MDYKTGFNKAISVILVLLLISVYVVYSDRTITDSSDTIYTQIYNSKGNTWTATGANIQLAIYDLANLSGTVYVPPGTFYLQNSLNIGSNCHLQGAGMYQTIIKMGVATALRSLFVVQKRNVILSDFTYHGNNSLSGGGAGGSHAISVREGRNVTIQNVRVLYPAGIGLCFTNYSDTYAFGCRNFTIDNYQCYHVKGTGAQHAFNIADSSNGTVTNVKVHGSYNGGDGFDMGPVDNITFNNIVIENITADGWKFNSGCYHLTVDNVRMTGINGKGIKFFGSNCGYINFNDVDITAGTACFYIYDTSDYPKSISNFHLRTTTATGGYGICSDLSVGAMKNWTISNGIIYALGDNGIWMTNARNITLSDIVIQKTLQVAIRFTTSKDIKISHCTVTQSSTAATYGGIRIYNSNRTLIDGCTIGKCISWGVLVTGSKNVTISNNDINYCVTSAYGGISVGNTSGLIISDNRIVGNHESIIMQNTYCNNYIIMGNYVSGNTHVPHNATGATWSQVFYNGPQIPT